MKTFLNSCLIGGGPDELAGYAGSYFSSLNFGKPDVPLPDVARKA
jgi:hypothetical protein